MSLNDAENEVDTFLDTEVEQLTVDTNDQDDEVEISFGEDSDEAQSSQEDHNESSVIKDLRKQLRQAQQEVSKAKQPTQEEPIVLGDKPTLEALEYDTDKYEAELEAYYVRKRKLEDKEANASSEKNKVIEAFTKQKNELGVKDFDSAKDVFINAFNNTQKDAILRASSNMALIIYALGKQPAKAEALARITDPIKLAAEVGKLEKDVKVIKKNVKVEPDKPLRGSGSPATTQSATKLDKELDKLREEAKKTGNMNKVRDFKKLHNIK